METVSCSPADILEDLRDRDEDSAEFAADLKFLLRPRSDPGSDDWENFCLSLVGPEVTELIELLDKARTSSSVKADDNLKRQILHHLKRICSKNTRLPSSHLIRHDNLKNKSQNPITGGGFAEVFRGEYENTLVAIKEFRVYEDAEIRGIHEAFCPEAVIWKDLSHENVLPLLGVSDFNCTRPYMLSEWMENGNLGGYLKSNPNENRLKLLLDVAKGLEYVHSRDVVHGDLKGHNIVVDNEGRALLADFGLASVLRGNLSLKYSEHASGRGTTRWMAPELLEPTSLSCEFSKKTDVHAFSMVAVEVFTGEQPFPHLKHEYHVPTVLLRGERPKRPSGITDDVWEMLQRCWAPKAADRPEMVEVASCLEQALATFTSLDTQ